MCRHESSGFNFFIQIWGIVDRQRRISLDYTGNRFFCRTSLHLEPLHKFFVTQRFLLIDYNNYAIRVFTVLVLWSIPYLFISELCLILFHSCTTFCATLIYTCLLYKGNCWSMSGFHVFLSIWCIFYATQVFLFCNTIFIFAGFSKDVSGTWVVFIRHHIPLRLRRIWLLVYTEAFQKHCARASGQWELESVWIWGMCKFSTLFTFLPLLFESAF